MTEEEFSLKGKEFQFMKNLWMSGCGKRYVEFYKTEDVEKYLKFLKRKLIEDIDKEIKDPILEPYDMGWNDSLEKSQEKIEKGFGDMK